MNSAPNETLPRQSRRATVEPEALLGLILAKAQSSCAREDWTAARDLVQLAVEIDPLHCEAHALLGNLHYRLNEFREACSELHTAVRLGMQGPDILVQLALAHLQLNQIDDAEWVLSLALTIDANHTAANRVIADIYRDTNRHQAALRHYRRLLESGANDSDICRSLGKCLSEVGEWEEAKSWLRRGLEQDPQNEAMREELVLVDRRERGLVRVLVEGTVKDLVMLPGSRYANCAIPLDYPPSRNLRPRWGYSEPPHRGLSDLFARWDSNYVEFLAEVRLLETYLRAIPLKFDTGSPVPGWIGPAVNPLDLAVLYCFIHRYRPATYIEIGSGATTCFARRAITDHRLGTKLISIDPEPRAMIDSICDHVVRSGLETLPDLSIFSGLRPNDIVFMDGSHRTFMNSDVTVFMLDILPQLKPGVIVHIHDIHWPWDYSEQFRSWYWSEQYIVAAHLLAAADTIEILMPVNYVSTHPVVKTALEPPILLGVGDPALWKSGGSLWFTRRAG